MAAPALQPEVVRRVIRIPRLIGRLALLHRLGLAEYCRTTAQPCILWCDGQIISHLSARPMEIQHGVYLRIAVPPGDQDVHHIGTRCVATACHQGITQQELCDRHALYSLGWYDTIIGPPLVPLRPDEEEVALLQTHAMPQLPEKPWFLLHSSDCQVDANVPSEHAEEDVGDITRGYVSTLGQELPGGIQPRPDLDAQPEHIHHLVEQLEEHGAVEVEEEGPILYVNTWYLHNPNHRQCNDFRTVRLAGNFAMWHQQILDQWRDLLEDGHPVDFYIVYPQPPTTRMQPEHLPHVIVLQSPPADERATVITVLDSRDPATSFRHSAHFLPLVAGKENVIMAVAELKRAIHIFQICNACSGMVNNNFNKATTLLRTMACLSCLFFKTSDS